MTGWLAPISDALDARDSETRIFFRDDDAGWRDARLFQLLDLFDAAACPIDLAVIPTEVTDSLAAALIARRRHGARIGLHQHGFSHANHEPVGRPCEFGPSRPPALQQGDIAEGRRRLSAFFVDQLDPFFTPPWNRCSADTGRALVASGLRTISRDVTAPPLGIPELAECPVHVDWFAKSRRGRLDAREWVSYLARRVAESTGAVGIMLHHARMDAADFDACDQLVRALSAHPAARLVPMREMVVRS